MCRPLGEYSIGATTWGFWTVQKYESLQGGGSTNADELSNNS